MYSFLKAVLVLMKLLSLSQFYALKSIMLLTLDFAADFSRCCGIFQI